MSAPRDFTIWYRGYTSRSELSDVTLAALAHDAFEAGRLAGMVDVNSTLDDAILHDPHHPKEEAPHV